MLLHLGIFTSQLFQNNFFVRSISTEQISGLLFWTNLKFVLDKTKFVLFFFNFETLFKLCRVLVPYLYNNIFQWNHDNFCETKFEVNCIKIICVYLGFWVITTSIVSNNETFSLDERQRKFNFTQLHLVDNSCL